MNLLNDFEVAAVAAEIGIFEWPQSTVLTASQAELPIGVLGPGPVNVAIGSVQIHPVITSASSDTNYWEFQIYKRTNGGAGVLIAQGSSSVTLNNPITGGLVAFKAASLTVVAGAFLTPLDTVTGVVTKVGAPTTNLAFYLAGFTSLN
jgi:hypothetical protein